MTISHGTGARGSLAQAMLDAVNQGSTFGHLKIFNSSNTVLADVTLQDPAFSRSGAVLTLIGVPLSDSSADASGTADHYEVQDSDANKIWGGSVTATGGGGDMTVETVTFVATQLFTITGCTYTAST